MRRPVSLLIASSLLCACFMSGCEGFAEETQVPQVTVPVAAQGEFIVGVICHGNKRDTEGFDAAHIEAVRAAADGFGVSTVRISDEVEGDVAVRNAVEDLAEYGCDIIFDIDFDHMSAFADAADEYPDIAFCQYGGYFNNETNFINYSGRMYQASYLAGIAEGYRSLSSGNNEIAYEAYEFAGPSQLHSMANAFALGAQAVNPDATVDLQLIEPDAESTEETAEALSAEPVVIDTSDMLTYPVEDLQSFYELAISTSMYEASASEFVSNMGGDFYGGLFDGYVSWAPLSQECPPEASEAIALAYDLMLSGQWDVFSGTALVFEGDAGNVSVTQVPQDLTGAGGNVIAEAGSPSLSDNVIRGYMDFYVEGID